MFTPSGCKNLGIRKHSLLNEKLFVLIFYEYKDFGETYLVFGNHKFMKSDGFLALTDFLIL